MDEGRHSGAGEEHAVKYFVLAHGPTFECALSPKVETQEAAWARVFPDVRWDAATCSADGFTARPQAETALLGKKREMSERKVQHEQAHSDPNEQVVRGLSDLVREGDRVRERFTKQVQGNHDLAYTIEGCGQAVLDTIRGRWADQILEVAKVRGWHEHALLALFLEALRERLVCDEFADRSSCRFTNAVAEARRRAAATFVRDARCWLIFVEVRDAARVALGLPPAEVRIDPALKTHDMTQILRA